VRILPKKYAAQFYKNLGVFGELHGPVQVKPGLVVFGPAASFSDLALDQVRTLLPVKKYLFPPKEEQYRFSTREGFVEPEVEEKRTVLFGVHPCDINAVALLDRVTSWKYPDPKYRARRQRLIIVGVDCIPDEYCFCLPMGSHTADEGFDLFLTDIGEEYFVQVGSSLGERMLRESWDLVKQVEQEHIEAFHQRAEERQKAFRHDLDAHRLAQAILVGFSSPVWDEVGKKCLSCGSCAATCPTCCCYDVLDEVNLDLKSGVRIRRWDDCMQPEFALVAGGHNFRAERSTRFKMRFMHKINSFKAEFQRLGCVGCGRCIAGCPADINVIEVFQKITGKKVTSVAG